MEMIFGFINIADKGIIHWALVECIYWIEIKLFPKSMIS